jgi:hypothetical protein
MTLDPSRSDDDPALVPLLEVARMLGVSANTVYRHRADLPFGFEHIGSRWYARRADLDAYVAGALRPAV